MPEWTKEQRRAIETDGRNLLVSAAAGSGKTAVLVERILQKLKRKEHPVNITNLLVVTFTRAAAAEMRERVQKEVVKAVEHLPDWTEEWSAEERHRMRRHLKKQTLLLEQAEICTIDSFCAGILRNYFHVIDLDPTTRLAAEDEIDILKSDVLAELLEEEYQKEDSGIGFLSEYLGTAKTADHLEPAILSLYAFSRNSVRPEEALEHYIAPYRMETAEDLRAAAWNREYVEELKKWIGGALEASEALKALAERPDGVWYLAEMAREENAAIRFALEAEGYEELRTRLAMDFPAIKRKPKDFGGDPEDHERAKLLRNTYKDILRKIQERTARTEEEILEEFRTARPAAEELVRLTKAFSERFAAEKRKLRVMDFNDQEHFVLDVLTENGASSEIAALLTDEYDEIMIDEYQDSNELQEAILTSFAKRNPETGEPVNVFMVGDIKQSIYRFRQANPELFIEKYRRYHKETEAPEAEKVELAANFRSKPGVTDAVNFFFEKWMREDVGGVGYSEEVRLNPRGQFPESRLNTCNGTKIMIVDPSDGETVVDGYEAEAHMIAQEIRRLMDERDGVYVAEGKDHVRKASYKDVVILLRSMSYAGVLQDVLESYGIPSYMKRKTGFYDTFEVQFAIQYLTVIDNPHDEVALTGVLRSPIVGLASEELAKAAAGKRRSTRASYLAALKEYAANGKDATAEKLSGFFRQLEHFRVLAGELKLSMLLRTVFRETGLLLFVNALPGGDQRQANLNELIGKAAEFEETSLIGVFNFIRYLEKNRERSDEGEVGTVGENEDLVRIMTIHASKGLEFPIVFVSNLGRNLNFSDESDVILKHDRLGIGLKVVRPDLRIARSKAYFREVIAESMRKEMLGEELRVLYVAMTRAKEMLYLTAAKKEAEEKLAELSETFAHGPGKLSFPEVASARSYLDLVLSAYRTGAPVAFLPVVHLSDLQQEAVLKEGEERLERKALFAELEKSAPLEAERELREVLGTDYHIDDLSGVYSTMSVSALKHVAVPEPGSPARSRVFVKDDRKIGGAELGTLYHRVMELVDPEKDAGEAVSELRKEGLISEAEEGKIDVEEVRAFYRSDLGRRFREAWKAGRGFRERQFIIGRPAKEIFPEAEIRSAGELVMIQGVIDLYFEEADGLVLVDYKTDRVRNEKPLVREYRVQLELYEKALEMMTGKPIKEKWIYSFALRKGISV